MTQWPFTARRWMLWINAISRESSQGRGELFGSFSKHAVTDLAVHKH